MPPLTEKTHSDAFSSCLPTTQTPTLIDGMLGRVVSEILELERYAAFDMIPRWGDIEADQIGSAELYGSDKSAHGGDVQHLHFGLCDQIEE